MAIGDTYKLVRVFDNGDLLIEDHDGKRSVLYGVTFLEYSCGMPSNGVLETATWKGATQ